MKNAIKLIKALRKSGHNVDYDDFCKEDKIWGITKIW
jgi:hypothetical protein